MKNVRELHHRLLAEELELWKESGEKDRKRDYYSFLCKELKKFSSDSVESASYLNLNFDPSNYRKLIFLPWNIRINDHCHPIFIEYKNL